MGRRLAPSIRAMTCMVTRIVADTRRAAAPNRKSTPYGWSPPGTALGWSSLDPSFLHLLVDAVREVSSADAGSEESPVWARPE